MWTSRTLYFFDMSQSFAFLNNVEMPSSLVKTVLKHAHFVDDCITYQYAMRHRRQERTFGSYSSIVVAAVLHGSIPIGACKVREGIVEYI